MYLSPEIKVTLYKPKTMISRLTITSAFISVLLIAAVLLTKGCKSTAPTTAANADFDTLITNQSISGPLLVLTVKKGEAFNYPLMAAWTEGKDSVYLQTLYVPESIATSIFRHGQADKGKWMPGEIRRPAALPYWGHSRGIKAADGFYIPSADKPMPDAVTGATPTTDFVLKTNLDLDNTAVFTVYFEINQSWDWNEYWTNNKYPDNDAYKSSSQPAIVYAAQVDMNDLKEVYKLSPVGHSHPAGENGQLFSDLSTLTSALRIIEIAEIRIVKN